MQRIKKTFLLLEILIALSLMSILLSFLFHAYAQIIAFDAKIASTRNILLERQRLMTRLQDVFLSIHASSFYTKQFPGDKQESLVAVFDNGIDPEAAFSGPVLARIYLDSYRNLILALWPLEKKKKKHPWRKETLLTEIDDFKFHMLGNQADAAMSPVNSTLAWHDRWPKTRPELPSMIRLTVTQNGAQLHFAFFCPQAEIPTWGKGLR